MDLKKPVVSLVILVGLLFALSAVSFEFAAEGPHAQAPSPAASDVDQNGVRVPPPMPPITAAEMTQAQDTHGFQLLVSYTNEGFEPTHADIQAGDTVRFTNNSTRSLWVAADGTAGPLYPNVQNGCGSSALDSCRSLSPGEYWEFTFAKAGTWSYENNLSKEDEATVKVK